MLPLKTLLYLGLFSAAVLAAVLYHPVIGIFAYLATYTVNPLSHWWGNYIPDLFYRYSYILVLATTAGIILNASKLRFKSVLCGQEALLVLFVMIMWISVVVGIAGELDYNVIKMSKVAVILLMASHLITTRRSYEVVVWILIAAGLYLGLEMYWGSGVYRGARFHAGIGGSDFGEGNFLAAHFGLLLPFIGVMFLRAGWAAKGFCVVSAVFVLNALILARSRGMFLALAVGAICAFLLALRIRSYRKAILGLMLLGGVASVYLADPGFWDRMETIQGSEPTAVTPETRDRSAEARLLAWEGAWAMAKDYPLGVGAGGFFDNIGRYEPMLAGRDAHNTYLRCVAELGFPGLFVLLLLIGNAFRMLFVLDREVRGRDAPHARAYRLHSYAVKISLVVYLIAGMFISSVYIEEFYWLLLMPVFLTRALENEVPEASTEKAEVRAPRMYPGVAEPPTVSGGTARGPM